MKNKISNLQPRYQQLYTLLHNGLSPREITKKFKVKLITVERMIRELKNKGF